MNFNFQPANDDKLLEKLGRNLNKEYLKGKINNTIGREDEIRRLIEILSRREKNNPILIGEPGVGKTAIVEGLVKRIVSNDVPNNLKDVEVYEISISSLMSGASFQGEFEKRFQNIMKQVKDSCGKIILFIDEIHQLVGTKSASASDGMDVGNMLKPLLARGDIKLIGATTYAEYRKYIEKDGALERRFQKINVSEPSFDETLTIMRGLKEKWEMFHGVKILDSALISAITLSQRYITDKYLPDKAIDIIDEAAAKINTQINSNPIELDNVNRKIIQLETEKYSLKNENDERSKLRFNEISKEIELLKNKQKELQSKWDQEKSNKEKINLLRKEIEQLNNEIYRNQSEGNFELASRILYSTLPSKKKELEKLENNESESLVNNIVNEKEVLQIVSKMTKIPVNKLEQSYKDKILNLKDNLSKRIIGQDSAINAINDSLIRNTVGINDPNRPIASYLFVGPTGVGKTEIAKALADQLFDSEKNIIRIDMSEFMEKHSVSKLIGSPPGYVGYDQAGQLSEAVRLNPYSIVLFDEIEKAHPDVLNLLLQILDDGILTDSQGKKINFKNTIIIMTSNVGAKYLLEGNVDKFNQEIKNNFKPEFLNRLDETIVFNNLSKDDVEKIIKIQLNKLSNRLKEQEYIINFDNHLVKNILTNAYDPVYGARPIKRYIQKYIESDIAKKILNGQIQKNKETIYRNITQNN